MREPKMESPKTWCLEKHEAQAVHLWHESGYSPREIAAGMHLTEVTVRSRIQRPGSAEKKLREIACWADA